MLNDPTSKADTSFSEAGASWNTRYVTPQGFTCQITLRGDSGKELLDKANTAIAYLVEHGFKPLADTQRGSKPVASSSGETRLCVIHQCEMKAYEKDGRKWFSHKTTDGRWCKGKPEKKESDKHG